MDGRMVIAVYTPKAGRSAELIAVLKRHLPLLRELGLATSRQALVMKSLSNGSILEIFEWKSEEAVAQAHEHPRVRAYWKEMEDVCTYGPPGALPEMQNFFPHFEPLNELNL